jgi:hypothetical protein
MNFLKCALLASLASIAILQNSHAQTVTLTGAGNNLSNTGTDLSGNLLNGGSQDPNFIVTAPAGNSVAHVVNGALPSGWTPNTTTAQWISFKSNAPTEVSGTFDYQLSLTNIPTNQVVTISGFIAADDQVNILANGTLAFSLTTNSSYAGSHTAFTLTYDSSSTGTNTLDFDVLNTVDNTTEGLLLDTISGSFTPVPEPREYATLLLLGAGLLVVARKLRSRFPQVA